MKPRQIVLLLALGAGAGVLGYFLAHVLFAERLITLFDSGGTEKFARGIVGDVYFQLLCGAPFPVLVGLVVAAIAVLVDRFIKIPAGIRLGIVMILSFVSGFMGYVPYQFVMLLASAF
jgi:hypothetical protein